MKKLILLLMLLFLVGCNNHKHEYDIEVIEATCLEGGYTKYSCKECEYSYVSDKTAVLTHNYSSTYSYDEHNHWYPCIDEGYEHLKKNGSAFKPFMTENFYLDDKGIHFIYNPIEIDCYAAGTINIFVPCRLTVK